MKLQRQNPFTQKPKAQIRRLKFNKTKNANTRKVDSLCKSDQDKKREDTDKHH